MSKLVNLKLFITLVILAACLPAEAQQVCETFPASPPGCIRLKYYSKLGKNLWLIFNVILKAPPAPILPERFSTRLEINLDGKRGSDIEMTFDYDRRKATIISQADNIETRLVFDYENDEIHMIACIFIWLLIILFWKYK